MAMFVEPEWRLALVVELTSAHPFSGFPATPHLDVFGLGEPLPANPRPNRVPPHSPSPPDTSPLAHCQGCRPSHRPGLCCSNYITSALGTSRPVPSSPGWECRSHKPCYQEACHLACRSSNSFDTRGAIVHLNIDFFRDTIACIPESDSLTEAKRFHLLYYETTPTPSRAPSQLNVTKQDKSEGSCVFFHLGQFQKSFRLSRNRKKTGYFKTVHCVCVWGGGGGGALSCHSPSSTPPAHTSSSPQTLQCSDIGLLIE